MIICNKTNDTNVDIFVDKKLSHLISSWHSLVLLANIIFSVFIVISVVWLIVLGKRYRKMKKQLRNELNINSESEEYSEEYFQLQSKRKALLLFILIITVELIIGMLLILPNVSMRIIVSVELSTESILYKCIYTNKVRNITHEYERNIVTFPTSTYLVYVFFTYSLSVLLQFAGFTFHTLTLAAIVQFYINIYTSRRDTVPLRKYLIPATLQFISIIILCPFIVTAPIITLLLFIYYPIDLYFLIRNSRRLKHLLVVRRNEAALIGPEMLKEHESHLKYFKRIWGSFMISFVICIVSLIIQSIITSVIITLYSIIFLERNNIKTLSNFTETIQQLIVTVTAIAIIDIIRIVTSFGYFQFLLYISISSIMYASVYLYKILKPCCKPTENELRPLIDEYINDVLAMRNNDKQEEPNNTFEKDCIATLS